LTILEGMFLDWEGVEIIEKEEEESRIK